MVDGIFDSHAHYDDDAFDADRDGLLRSLASHGVRPVSYTHLDVYKRQSIVYSSFIGIHLYFHSITPVHVPQSFSIQKNRAFL